MSLLLFTFPDNYAVSCWVCLGFNPQIDACTSTWELLSFHSATLASLHRAKKKTPWEENQICGQTLIGQFTSRRVPDWLEAVPLS